MALEQSLPTDTRPEMSISLLPLVDTNATAALSSPQPSSFSSSSSAPTGVDPHIDNLPLQQQDHLNNIDDSSALVAAAHNKIHLASTTSLATLAGVINGADSSSIATTTSLPSPLSPPLSVSPPKHSATMNMMSTTSALPPVHPSGTYHPHHPDHHHLSPARLSTSDNSLLAFHQHQLALASSTSHDTLPPLNTNFTSFSRNGGTRSGGHAHTSSVSSTVSAGSLSSSSYPLSPVYTQSPTQGDFGAFSSNNDDSGDEIDMNVRPSVLRASLMARARISTARSRLSTQSMQSVQSTQSMFEPRHTARSSISSAGWTSPTPRARSASVGSVGSNDSVDLDAIIASGSDINDGEQLDLAGMDDDLVWGAKDSRKADQLASGTKTEPGFQDAELSESQEEQLEDAPGQDGSVPSHHNAIQDRHSDWHEHDETARESEEQTTIQRSPSRALSSNGHVSPDIKKNGRNPYDLESDYLDEHPVEGLVNVSQHQALRLRPAVQLPAPRQLARPSAGTAGAGGAGVSRLAPPRAGSVSATKSGLVPPRASGLARPTAGRPQPSTATASTATKTPASAAPRLAPPTTLRPGRYAMNAGTGSAPGIKTPGSGTAMTKTAAAGSAAGSGLKAPLARSNTGLARPSTRTTATAKPVATKPASIPRPGVRAGSGVPASGARAANIAQASASLTGATGSKRPTMLQQPGSIPAKSAAAPATAPQSRLRPMSGIVQPSTVKNNSASTVTSTISGLRSPGRSATNSNLARPVSMLASPSSSHSSTSSLQSALTPSSSGLTSPRPLSRSSTFQQGSMLQRPLAGRNGRRSVEPLHAHEEVYADEHGYQGGEEEDYAILTPPQSPHSSRTGGGGGQRSMLPSPSSSSGIPKPGVSRIGSVSKIGTLSRLPTVGSGLTSPRVGTSRYS